MAADQKNLSLLFSGLNRQLTKLAAKPKPNSVHRFRTNGRRLEVVLAEFASGASRNRKKLLKMLVRLRKKAGKARDLDVQIALLRSLKMPEGARHKSQLMQTLMDERAQREKKLIQAFDKKTVRELQKRLKRAASGLEIREQEGWAKAKDMLSGLGRQSDPVTERTLHQYRILGKRMRYLAELSDADPDARAAVAQLKKMQDLLGEWHDWLKLMQRARSLFCRRAQLPAGGVSGEFDTSQIPPCRHGAR